MTQRSISWTFLVAALVLCTAAAAATAKTKVCVVGDSLATNEKVPWPAVMAKLLGDEYEVRVFAANGLTVQTRTYRTIWGPPPRYEHVNARDYRGDITLVCFGANAAKPGNWSRKGEWVKMYKHLIGMYKGKDRKVYIVLPPPAATESPYGISRKILHEQTIPALKEIAKATGAEVIDAHTPLLGRTDVTCDDGLYPTPLGHEIIGKVVYMALTGKTVEIPAAPEPPTKEEIAAEDAAKHCKLPCVVALKPGESAVLTPEYVQNEKGDGPDGKGNTNDDTWQFWFELAHSPTTYHRLSLATRTLTPDQRQNGVPRRITGPVGGWLPNPKETEGWIFGTDWDGRGEGVWGDLKAQQVLAHPYVEKNSHCCLAISFRVPADGVYDVTATLTDLKSVNIPQMTGITWQVELAHDWNGEQSPKAYKIAAKGGPIGDGKGPDSGPVEAKGLECKKGDLIRLVIDPNKYWGTDLTKIDKLTITRVK